MHLSFKPKLLCERSSILIDLFWTKDSFNKIMYLIFPTKLILLRCSSSFEESYEIILRNETSEKLLRMQIYLNLLGYSLILPSISSVKGIIFSIFIIDPLLIRISLSSGSWENSEISAKLFGSVLII